MDSEEGVDLSPFPSPVNSNTQKQLVRIQDSNQRLYFPRIQIVYGSQSYTSKATVSNFSSEPKGGIGTKEGRGRKNPIRGWERALSLVFSGLQAGCVPSPEDQLQGVINSNRKGASQCTPETGQ